MLYLQKYFTNFQKHFLWLKDEEFLPLWLLAGWKFLVHRDFGFAIATLQLFQNRENVKISIFPFKLSREKCYIFKSILRIFKNILFAERIVVEEWWLLWLKISCAQRFWFCNSNVTTFQTRENVKISISPFTMSPQKCHIFKSI